MCSRKVLLVDDEPRSLEVMLAGDDGDFQVDVVDSPAKAWGLLTESSGYAVVVSDMHMPLVDGVQFLATVKNRFPTITRIIMTSDTDQEIAVKAVNEGEVFRFLRKPLSATELRDAFRDGLSHHRALDVEASVLEETLKGSINLMVDLLSEVKPLAFGRSRRVRALAAQVSKKLGVTSYWEVKVAAMLSQIGCISLSDELLEAVHSGEDLKAADQIEFNEHIKFGESLIENIPRMATIGRLVGWQLKRFDELRILATSERELTAASILATCLAFDRRIMLGDLPEQAIEAMRVDHKLHCIKVVDALEAVVIGKKTVKRLDVWNLRAGMTIDSDVKDSRGALLVPRGQVITSVMLRRLQQRAASIDAPIHVVVSETDSIVDPFVDSSE